jgi:lysyl-tRNA synthetase class 2
MAVKQPIVKGYKTTAEITTHVVASWPSGGTWPDADDPAARRRRTRNVRRVVAASVFSTGVLDILVALAPPLRGRLTSLAQFLPLSVAQTAGAFVALTGLILMMLARGVLRGQWRPWVAAVMLLGISTVLHVIHAVSFGAVLLSTSVLIVALTEWRSFRGETDRTSTASGFATLLFGGFAALLTAFIVTEVTNVHKPLPGVGTVLAALLERFFGITTIALPDRVNDWVTPVLTGVGITLVVAALYLLTRPVVDRRHLNDTSQRRARDLERARDIVARHGRGTLDYFALRDDKQFFFTQDSLVAYAVFGGICIASPDPIGPAVERRRAIEDFWAFADANGWGVGVVGAAEEWLPLYLAAGMRSIYIGDEAVVDVTTFSLAGNKMKGLRQAVSRVERLGYSVEFLDPALASPAIISELVPLLTSSRRGDEEKGFSMMLGRMFHSGDEGLLLTVVRDAERRPVALCQFVPSAAISGYSLDCMRRDRGDHPNGLLDFALCKTIAYLAERGGTGLSLNFAVLRSALAADGDITLLQRIERFALLKLSGVLQIESLWKFNAKYEPTWQPRYIVYDSPEQFLPSVVSFLRAESVSDVPVIGRLFSSKHRSQAIVLGTGSGEETTLRQ